jgi:nicotinate dehydrogenase subunit A
MSRTKSTRLLVNGTVVDSAADPDTPLLYVLRNDLGLKGTRFGCGTGECGACTVHVDGIGEPSCILPLSAIGGKPIVTVEGLSSDGRLDPLQRAFLSEQAGQCGYCISGILMSARALLDRNPRPNRDDIRTALDGNLCRCGVMDRMVRAVERASRDVEGDA